MVVSQSLTPTQSTVSISKITSVSQVVTQTQSSVVLSQGLLKSPPTQSTDVVRPSSEGHNKIKTQEVVKGTASKTDLTKVNLFITLGILWSYLIYLCWSIDNLETWNGSAELSWSIFSPYKVAIFCSENKASFQVCQHFRFPLYPPLKLYIVSQLFNKG